MKQLLLAGLDQLFQPLHNLQQSRNLKKQAQLQRYHDQYGFVLESSAVLPPAHKMLNCLLRGILIFLGVITPIDMLNSAFDIPYQPLLVMGILFLIALLISSINYHWILRAVGLITFFIVFVFMTFSAYRIVNSGFNALLNIISEYASYELDTEAIRTYEETISNRALTIPTFYIFIGSVALIFLNFILNNFMSAPFILVCSIPFWTLSFYFDIEPKAWHFISYAFLLMTITILKHCNQYNLPDGKAMNQVRHNKKKHDYLNISNGKIMLQTSGFIAVLLTILLVLSSVFYPAARLRTPAHWNEWKQSTQDTARILVSQGLSGLFRQEEASGGLSYGTLGAGRISPNFQTDYVLTLAPAHYDNVYIRSYIGNTYLGNSWKSSTPVYLDAWLEMEEELYRNLSEKLESLSPEEALECGIYRGKIRIDVKDYFYGSFTPYYATTDISDSFSEESATKRNHIDENGRLYIYQLHDLYQNHLVSDAESSTYETTYYHFTETISNSFLLLQYDFTPDIQKARSAEYTLPTAPAFSAFTSESIREDAYSMLDDVYLDVIDDKNCSDYDPELLKQTLIDVCEEQQFGGTALEIIIQVMDYLENNFRYSLNPGNPDKNLDFATNFLTKNNYGYCAHFATAGTLLLRTMGIPARYVEGYVVTFDDMTTGTILTEEDYHDWLYGDYETEDSAVVSVDVLDSSAHAWVEVYFEGLGWVPLEFTNAALAEPEEDPYDFWNDINNPLEDMDTTGIENLLTTDLTFVWNFLRTTLLMLVTGAAIALLVFLFIRFLRRDKIEEPYHQGISYRILKKYRQMLRYLKALGYLDTTEVLHSTFAQLLTQRGWLPETQSKELQALLDRAGYSADTLTLQDLQTLDDAFAQIQRSINNECRCFRKCKAMLYRIYLFSFR